MESRVRNALTSVRLCACACSIGRSPKFLLYTTVGHDMPYFAGVREQQGYGLGILFSSIAKSVFLLVKKGAKALGKKVLQSGVEFASDVLPGKNV